ncbi:hypothetical protein M9Y10_035407 [Tritrichomonas musculus]|uniref:BEACH domain-containing protein n=1 Tax=Tritrichomonas musculus TaxID=1915356 RepID=A0ABR2KIF6_9EUKA
MFKKIANIIPRRNSTTQNPNQADQDSQVNIFAKNLELFNTIKDKPDRVQLFERTISHFKESFYDIDHDQAQDPHVRSTLQKYCELGAELGTSIVSNQSKLELFVDSLIFIFHTYSDLPGSSKYITFFYDLIQTLKKTPEILDSVFGAFTILFRSKGFFRKFLKTDGYTLIYTSFYMKFVSKECQDQFNHLLFDNIPKDFTNYYPQEGLLELFVSSLSSSTKEATNTSTLTPTAEIITPSSVTFICNFLTTFHKFDSDIFTKFDDKQGFLNLNNYLILNNQEIATSIYQKMLIVSNGSPSVISNLFILYTREQTKPEIRTSLLNLLYTLSVPALAQATETSAPTAQAPTSSASKESGSSWNRGLDLFKVSSLSTLITGNNDTNNDTGNGSQTARRISSSPNLPQTVFSLDTIFQIAPIQLWILPPPQLNREGLILIAIYLKELSRSGTFPIKSSLSAILQIIRPPIKSGNEIPIDSFLELIESAITQRELAIQDLIEKKFIEDFILLPSEQDVALYFEKHLLFRLIIIKIYSDKNASEFRFPVVQKFILVSKYLKNMKDFIDFLSALFSRHFSQQIIPLMLNFISNKDLVLLFESELQKRGECYHYFLDCNGFIYLDEFMKTNPSQVDEVIRLIASLSYTCPKNEINEWLLNQPNSSPIFTYDKDFLGQAAFAFRTDTTMLMIPSFFPFIQEANFDTSIMTNLYLAGKYGIPMYKKLFGDLFKYENIPYINFISDRFILPEDVPTILNSDLCSSFVHRDLPHFSVYEFIPELFRSSYFKISSYDFVSLFFNFKRFQPIAVTVFHNKAFVIKVEADTFMIYSPKNQLIYNCVIQENVWNHIVFNFKNYRRRLEIEMNGNKLCAIDTTLTNNNSMNNNDLFGLGSSSVDGMNIIVGDDEKPIESGFLVAKKILVADNSLSDTKNIWHMSPAHSYKGLKDAHIEKIEYVFISHYQGFASYFNTVLNLEEIFLKFDNEKDIANLRVLHTFLLKLQVVNEIPPNRFWERLFLSLKRQKEIIKNDLNEFAFHIPKAYYESNEMRTKYLGTLLNDIELFFLFSNEQVLNLLKLIENELKTCFELDESTTNKIMLNISVAMRSGLDEQIVLQFIPIFAIFISMNPSVNKYRYFLNMAISSCDWNQAMSYTLPDFPAQVLMDIDLPPTTVSNALLVSFISLAKKYENELYSYHHLLNFMLLFEDERSLHFANLILHYSLKNPKYIKDSLLANYVFSCHCDSRDFWIVAFSILNGKNSIGMIPKQSISIEQKEFLPVIISMLSRLCGIITSSVLNESSNLITFSNDSSDTQLSGSEKARSESSDNVLKSDSDLINLQSNSKDYLNDSEYARCRNEIALTREIFDAILAINHDHYSYFLQSSCQIPLYILSNLGMMPKSITQNWERIKCEFLSYTPCHLSREEIDSMIGLCDYFQPFAKIIKESEFVMNAKTNNVLFSNYLKFPFDLSSNQYINKLPFITNLLSLFSSILFSVAPNNFGNYLMDLVTGHSIMYNCFSRMFGQELIFMVIIKLTISDVPLDLYHKPLFLIIAKCIKDNLFDEKIIHLLSLVFSLLRQLQAKELFKTMMKDQAVISAYRDMILGGFVILNGSKSLKELFTLFISYQSVVFYSPLFENREFSLIWIHITRINQLNEENAITSIEKLMKIVPENLLNEYKSEEVESIWKSTSVKYCKQFKDEQTTMNSKDKKSKLIQNYEQQKINFCSNELLFISLFRVCNHYIQSNSQIYRMNIRNRQYEASQYLMAKNTRTFSLKKEFKINSYRLVSNPLPLYNSSCVSPSPYKILTPKFEKKFNLDLFKIETQVFPPRIEQIKQKGTMICSPEWFYFHTHEKEFESAFEYSSLIEQKPNQLLKVFTSTYNKYGTYVSFHNVQFFYYIHTLPSVLMVAEKGIILLVLAELNQTSSNANYNNLNMSMNNSNSNDSLNNYIENDINLISEPQRPVAFLPLTEAVALNEYHHTSLFCGHIVIFIDFDRFIRAYLHLFIHQKTSLRLTSLYDPTTIVVFSSIVECETCERMISRCIQSSKYVPFLNQVPFDNFIFSIESVSKANELWTNGKISNSDYLLLLNHFSGRSFSDLTQYPVFPWVVSPQLQQRDLSLPMGQLNKDRAAHFDTTYELSNPKYYYGFHYSIPGIVFWLLMRLPPFTFFSWDLNVGWDDQQRLFVSIIDAYQSAAVANQSDLKELVPELYSVPEAFVNISNLDFSGTEIKENVVLPEWSNKSPYKYVDVMRKRLENCEKLNEWIDLIFGFKETGDAALQSKNLFLPTCYHSATAENLGMDPPAFDAQVINFGQCPIQLFFRPHNVRKPRKFANVDFINLFAIKIHHETAETAGNTSLIDVKSSSNINASNVSSPISMQSVGPGSLNKNTMNYNSTNKISNTNIGSLTGINRNVKSNEIANSINAFNNSSIVAEPNKTANDESGEEAEYGKFTYKFAVNAISNSQLLNNQKASIMNDGGFDNSSSSLQIHIEENDNDSNIYIDVNSKAKAKMDEQSNQTPRNSLFTNVALCDVGGYAMTCISCAIPPRFYHFVAIDVFQECLTLNSITSKKILFSYSSSYYAFATHVSVSPSGMFCVVSFSTGMVNVYRIIYAEKEPIGIEQACSFSNLFERCNFSSVFSQDFICVSACGNISNNKKVEGPAEDLLIDFSTDNSNAKKSSHADDLIDLFASHNNNQENQQKDNHHDDLIDFSFGDHENETKDIDKNDNIDDEEDKNKSGSRLIFWNFATNLLQCIVHLDYDPVAMVSDDVTDTLTIIGPTTIEQYTINGKKIHTYQFHEINKNSNQSNELRTVSILPFNFTFDDRLIVCGDKLGNLNFFVIDESSYEIKFIHSKKIHIFPIVSIFILPNRNKIITNDTNGNKFITKLTIKEDSSSISSPSNSETLLQAQSISLSSTSFSNEIYSSSFITSPTILNDQDENLIEIDNDNDNDAKVPSSLVDEACYCAFCENIATVKCMNCGIPLCSHCVVVVRDNNEQKVMKLCQNCASEWQSKNQNDDNQNENDNNADDGDTVQTIQVQHRLSSFF